MTGTGGSGTDFNYGVLFDGSSIISTGMGTVTVTGIAGNGTSSDGILLQGTGSTIQSNSGAIDLTGTASGSNFGINLDSGTTITSSTGQINLLANTINLGDTSQISTGGNVYLNSDTDTAIGVTTLGATVNVTAGTFFLNDTLSVDYNTSVSRFDTINLTGGLNLVGSTLQVDLTNYNPATNPVSTLISDDGTDAVIGDFTGLAEGALVGIKDGYNIFITYKGDAANPSILNIGSGNDVQLYATLNNAPVAVDDTATTAKNTALVIPVSTLLANDSDPDNNSLSITAVSNANNGTAVLNDNGTPGNSSDDVIIFTPTTGFTGNASFDYTLSDGSLTSTGNVTVAVESTGINLGNLTNYLFFFANGSKDANWQGASKVFVGDVAVDGIQASERTSGSVPYAGTIYTNDSTLGAWQNIVNQNSGQASVSTGENARISGLETDLNNAFAQINALSATSGYTSVSSTSLNGLNTTNGINETFVINITSGLNFSSKINITGDAGDMFVLRWDTDLATPGYQGIVKPQSGGAIVPLGGLKPSNFINVAGDISASGGGTNPASPYPQGPRFDDGTGSLITNGSNFNGGGFFTGYWLTTGNPITGDTHDLSNGIFVGGWYTLSDKFSLTSGTSGVHVSPNLANSITGTPYNDVLIGSSNNDVILGGAAILLG